MDAGKISQNEDNLSVIRAEIAFDSIRVYIKDQLHIDIRRSTYRGMQAWKWPGHYVIEFALDGSLLKIEYTNEDLWKEVLEELRKLPLNGE